MFYNTILTTTILCLFCSFKTYSQIYFTDTCNTAQNTNGNCVICMNTYTNTISRVGFSFKKKRMLWYVYLNNEISEFGELKNGLKTGLWVEYYLSGTQVDVGKYSNGLRQGKWKRYRCPNIDFRVIPEYKYFLVETLIYENGKFIRRKN